MKNKFRVIRILGIVLIVLSLAALLGENLYVKMAAEKNAAIAEKIESLLPKRTGGTAEDYSSWEMPSLQVDGTDYVCLLEVPSRGVLLPVKNEWQKNNLSTPCRFYGSIYDGTLILGGSGKEGQFDFCAELELGDKITVTDMQGTEFYCRAERIDRSKTAEFEVLESGDYPLTLFVRDRYDGYIIVRCAWAY